MRKFAYFLILVVCLGAGLGVGYIRRHHQASDGGITIGDARPVGTVDVPVGAAAGGAGMTGGGDAGAPPSAPATPTQVAVAATPNTDTDIAGGRGFATGANADPVKPTSSSGGSTTRTRHSGGGGGGSSGSGASSGGDGFSGGGFTGNNSSGGNSSSSVSSGSPGRGNEVFDSGAAAAPTKTPKGKKGKVAETASAGSTDSLDSLPTIDDGGAPAKPSPAATAAAANEDFLNAPTTTTQVAMIPSGGTGDITFPAASGAALKKISQHQAGDKSVVHIERSGDAKYQVFKLKKTDVYPARVWVDFEETAVPGGDAQPVAGEAHIKDISARYIKNSGGGIPKARVVINLSDDKLPTVDCQEQSGGIDCTIGGATIEKF